MCHTCCVEKLNQALDECLESQVRWATGGLLLPGVMTTSYDNVWQQAVRDLMRSEPYGDIQTALCELWTTRNEDLQAVLSAAAIAAVSAAVRLVEKSGGVTLSLLPDQHFLAHQPKPGR
jgi:hypothetical protein